ncbi:hypothetical protein, partial [Tolypothrix sp. NIES-4075]|uniref:hypothetical protein n=1 Tax=Tolypothrix sp. NIES-4075 TaxID=2005459 RepID=UPI00190ED887
MIIVDDDLGLLLKLSALTNIVNFPPDPKNSEGVVQALYRLREFAAKAQATVNAGQSIGSRLAAFPPASNGTAGFFTYGLAGGEPVFDNRGYKRTPTEETADEVTKLGKQSGSQIKDAVDNSKKLLDDLWRNKPTFEIPQIKIPKFDIPELPNLEIPKFPEFKFPEISFPKPQPIPIPKLKPIPIPKPKPDINSEWVEVPGGDYCTAYFGFTIRVKKNLIQSISGGISFYGQEENLPPNWGNCSTYSVRNPDLKYPSVVA